MNMRGQTVSDWLDCGVTLRWKRAYILKILLGGRERTRFAAATQKQFCCYSLIL